MFYKNSDKNNTTKGIRAIAERTFVMLLSFMMMVTVIPFSMYDFDSHAADTYSNGESIYQYDESVRHKVSNNQIPDNYQVLEYIYYNIGTVPGHDRTIIVTDSPAGHNTEAYISVGSIAAGRSIAGINSSTWNEAESYYEKDASLLVTTVGTNGSGIKLVNVSAEADSICEEMYSNPNNTSTSKVKNGFRYKVHFFRGYETYVEGNDNPIGDDNFNIYNPNETADYYEMPYLSSSKWSFPASDYGEYPCCAYYEFYRFYYEGELTGEWIAVNDINTGNYGFYDIKSGRFEPLNYNETATADAIKVASKATVTTMPVGISAEPTGVKKSLLSTSGEASTFMEYALGTNGETVPTEGWSKEIPEASTCGDYYVWYRAAAGPRTSDYEKYCNASTPKVVLSKIAKQENPITAPETWTWNTNRSTEVQSTPIMGITSAGGSVSYAIVSGNASGYFSINESNLTMAANTPIGDYELGIEASAAGNSTYEPGSVTFSVKVHVDKMLNPIKASVNDIWVTTFSTSDQSQNFNPVSSAEGNVTYSIKNVTKGGTTVLDCFEVDETKLTMKGNSSAGNYVVTIQASADGTGDYAAGSVTFDLEVKVAKAANTIMAPENQTWNATYSINEQTQALNEFLNEKGNVVYSIIAGETDYFKVEGTTLKMKENTPIGTYVLTIKGYSGGTENYLSGIASYKVTVVVSEVDDSGPITTISSTYNVSEKQDVTIRGTDNSGVIRYYFGTSENATPNTTEGIVRGKIEKNGIEITKPGTYWFIAEDSSGNRNKTSITFYETVLYVENGSTVAEKVLTASGNRFILPTIYANPGYVAPDKWSNGMAPGTEFEPTTNTELKAKCWPEGYTSATFEASNERHSLMVGADLAVNFYLDMPSNYRNGTMTFTIEHGTPVEVSGVATTNGMKFTCGINVNQISDGITWKYEVDGNVATNLSKFSFYDYLIEVTNEYKEDYPELAEFADKLKTYGYYAQNYLAAEGEYDVASKHNVIPTPSSEPSTTDFSSYVLSKSGTNANNIAENPILQSLVLDTTTSIKLYVPLVNGSEWISSTLPEITINGTPIAAGKAVIADAKSGAGKELVIEIPGVNATKYADEYTVVIDGDYTIKTTALAYANKLKGQTSDYAKKLGAALFDLYQAAKGYRDSRSN